VIGIRSERSKGDVLDPDHRREERPMKKLVTICVASASLVLGVATAAFAAGSGGVSPGAAIYVDGVAFRTVGTPTDLSRTNAPASSFQTLYNFQGAQPISVATAGPGDPGFRGGRWMVHGLTFTDYDAAVAAFDTNASGDFDSDEEVRAALAAGAATDVGIIKMFECPLIHLP
jgi:hypothetical protein